jgi:hypothetical protein
MAHSIGDQELFDLYAMTKHQRALCGHGAHTPLAAVARWADGNRPSVLCAGMGGGGGEQHVAGAERLLSAQSPSAEQRQAGTPASRLAESSELEILRELKLEGERDKVSARELEHLRQFKLDAERDKAAAQHSDRMRADEMQESLRMQRNELKGQSERQVLASSSHPIPSPLIIVFSIVIVITIMSARHQVLQLGEELERLRDESSAMQSQADARLEAATKATAELQRRLKTAEQKIRHTEQEAEERIILVETQVADRVAAIHTQTEARFAQAIAASKQDREECKAAKDELAAQRQKFASKLAAAERNAQESMAQAIKLAEAIKVCRATP